jgi:restriction system protein
MSVAWQRGRMAIPDFQTLMLPVLRTLAGRPWRTAELVSAMANEFRLTEAEQNQLLSGGRQTVIANRTHWALAYLHKAGLVVRIRRGEYDITPSGRELLKAPPDRITVAFLLRGYPGVRQFRGKADATPQLPVPSDGAVAAVAETPREMLERAAAELRAALVSDLLEQVRAMDPSAFEQLIVDLMLAMGFGGSHLEAGQRLGRTGDGGVDGVIRQDALGLDVIYLQAKRYAGDNTVGAPVIQTFAGALLQRGAMKGVFVTTSSFSAQAREAVSNFGSHKIVLIDGEELARLMIEHEVGVRTIQTIKVQRVDLEAYAEDGS